MKFFNCFAAGMVALGMSFVIFSGSAEAKADFTLPKIEAESSPSPSPTVDPNYETPEEKKARLDLEAKQLKVIVANEEGRLAKEKSLSETEEKISKTKKKIVKVKKQKSSYEGEEIATGIVAGIFAGNFTEVSQALQKKVEYDNLGEEIKSLRKKLKSLKKEREKISKTEVKSFQFDPQDITKPSNLSIEHLETMLDGTELKQFAETFYEIEQEYGVNAVAIASIAALESNWGTSRRAREDHNYTGFGVYSDSATGINVGSGEENLKMTAKHLAENYLVPTGTYYNGVSIFAVNEKYCVGHTWGMKVTNIAYRLMNAV